jgi:hypothetical protein
MTLRFCALTAVIAVLASARPTSPAPNIVLTCM